MYKIMIHIETHTGDTWFYYQEEGKDYVANTLQEIKETVLTLIDVYGEDYIKIVKQETGDDMNGSVETFLYDSTDNYEELNNRPFINGIEVIGQLSLEQLGIQPTGDYALNHDLQRVEDKIDNIDLSPYATNTKVAEVENKIDNIDLTSYATNVRVDGVELKVDAIDLTPYATMEYLDEVVAGIDFSSTNEEISGVKTFSVLPRSTVMPVTEDELTNKSYVDHEVLGCATEEYVDEAIANIKIPVFEVASLGAVQYDAYMTEEEGRRFLEYCNEHYNEFIQVYLYCPTLSLSGIYSGTPVANAWGNGIFKLYSNATGYKSGIIYSTHLYVNANMTEDGRFDTTQSCRPYIHCDSMLNVSANYLSITNTREYTPTSTYHPATKKYVDDTLANIDVSTVIELTDEVVIINDYPSGIYQLKATQARIKLYNEGRTDTLEQTGMLNALLIWNNEKRTYLYISGASIGVNSFYGTTSEYYSLDKRLMWLYKDQEISGKKTFTTLPETSITPTLANQLVNKAYVDALASQNKGIQVLTADVNKHLDNGIYLIDKDNLSINAGASTSVSYKYGTMVFKDLVYINGTHFHIYMALDYSTADGPQLKISYVAAGSYRFTNIYVPFNKLATKDYVDTAISNIEIPEVNLDDYATIEYIDNSLANISIPDTFYVINLAHTYGSYIFEKYDPGVQYLTTADSQLFADYLNKHITQLSSMQVSKPLVIVINGGSPLFITRYTNGYNSNGAHTFTLETATLVQAATSGSPSDWSKLKSKFTRFSIYLKYEDGIYSAVDDFKSYFITYMYEDYLALNNSTAYTPTSDYNPATKKYVDEAIASSITSVLEGGY